MGSFWSKKAADMTIADTFKFTGIMTVAEEIKDWISSKFKRKEVKPTLSEEEEDDWGV